MIMIMVMILMMMVMWRPVDVLGKGDSVVLAMFCFVAFFVSCVQHEHLGAVPPCKDQTRQSKNEAPDSWEHFESFN